MPSPYINHFLQPDTLIPDLSNPQSWNRYSYVTNRPVNFSDPSGHKACDGDGADGECDQSGIPGTLGELKRELRSYGVTLKNSWKFDDAYDAYYAVYSIGEAFSRVTNESGKDVFRRAFGSLNLYNGSAPDMEISGYFGRTGCGANGCNIALKPGSITARLITHELGHAFEKRMWYSDGQKYTGTNNPIQMLSETGVFDVNNNLITKGYNRYNGLSAPDNGYYCNCYTFRESQYHSLDVDKYWNDPSEDFADIFMNWVYDSFYPNNAGAALFDWTESNMANWLQ